MKAFIVGLALASFCSASAAEDAGWVLVDESEKKKTAFYMKKGTLEITQNRAGDKIVVVVGKTLNRNSDAIELFKWYVQVNDCLKEQGQLVTLSISGEYEFENDFVFGSGTIGTTIAEVICGIYGGVMDEQSKKGI